MCERLRKEPDDIGIAKDILTYLSDGTRSKSFSPIGFCNIITYFSRFRMYIALLAAPKKEGKNTKEISRSHKIIVSDNGLVTITGGKWTSYRLMAEDTEPGNPPPKDYSG